MRSFNRVFDELSMIEKGYVDNPDDLGEETYRGISRRFHPNWSGWEIIDRHKPHSLFPKILEIDGTLRVLVKNFYRINFWNEINGENLSSCSYDLVNEVFDTAVNMSAERAGEFLQRCLNVLNTRNNKSLYPDLIVDGDIGAKTLSAVRDCINAGRIDSLLCYMNVLQGSHYFSRAEENKTQENFMHGWAKRVNFVKS